MKYMGSKRRLAKHIAPIIQGFIDSGQYKTYIEPFVGGANMIEAISCRDKQGSDSHRYLIELMKFVSEGNAFRLPDTITEEEYIAIKDNKGDYPAWLVGFCGFNATFGAKWFGGYARPRKDGYDRDVVCGKIGLTKQGPLIADTEFRCCTYKNWAPENCVVYCDPPYQKTTKYSTDGFNHKEFWLWCRKYSRPEYNNTILVSEYEAPEMFAECIWSKEIENTLSKDAKNKKAVEKLFWVKHR